MSDALRQTLRGLLGLAAPAGPALGAPPAGDVLLPEGRGPFPAVLYCHAHGGEPALGAREVRDGARWLVGPYAPELLEAGFAVLCVDMPGFGARQHEGSESALAKAGAWQGRPLFGRMVAAQIAALDRLLAHPEIDPGRIATLGLSMGGALAFWTAALDTRVAACVQMCILADIAPLIATGAHDRHGPYLTVPGLLRVADMGTVAGLIAPRPQLICLGAQDPFTPPAARDAALAATRAAYAQRGGRLSVLLDQDGGHGETPRMRREVLDFLQLHPCRTQERIQA